MQRIAEAIKWLHPDADFRSNVRIENDGSGPRIVEWALGGSPPTDAQLQAAIAEIDAAGPPPERVQAERARRLELGFAYDFGDARGVHHIGTTPADMVGWREVTDYANALIDLGDVTTEIAIVTDTGPVSVTAPEWQAVMLHAARVRQVIWAKSFALQAMRPIPADYADDRHWS